MSAMRVSAAAMSAALPALQGLGFREGLSRGVKDYGRVLSAGNSRRSSAVPAIYAASGLKSKSGGVQEGGESRDGNSKSERNDQKSVAMETVAKRAPATAERPVSVKDLPIENPCEDSHIFLSVSHAQQLMMMMMMMLFLGQGSLETFGVRIVRTS